MHGAGPELVPLLGGEGSCTVFPGQGGAAYCVPVIGSQ